MERALILIEDISLGGFWADFNEYQKESKVTDTKVVINDSRLAFYALGISDEAGEVAGKVKKLYRDKNAVLTEEYKKEIIKEIGDVLWYMSQMCTYLGVNLEEVAKNNLEKIKSRHARGLVSGNGDNR